MSLTSLRKHCKADKTDRNGISRACLLKIRADERRALELGDNSHLMLAD